MVLKGGKHRSRNKSGISSQQEDVVVRSRCLQARETWNCNPDVQFTSEILSNLFLQASLFSSA